MPEPETIAHTNIYTNTYIIQQNAQQMLSFPNYKYNSHNTTEENMNMNIRLK